MYSSGEPGGRLSRRASTSRTLAWICRTWASTSSGTLPAIRAICSSIARCRSAGSSPERRSRTFGGGTSSAPIAYRPTTTTGHSAPTTPARKSTRPASAPTQPAMFLFEYRYWVARCRRRPGSLVPTDLLERILQGSAAGVEQPAAAGVGGPPQLARVGLAEPDRERLHRPGVLGQRLLPGQEVVYRQA